MSDTENPEGEEALQARKEREEENAAAHKMLEEQRLSKLKEIEELKAKKEARRIEREKQMETIKRHEKERRARQLEEAKGRKAEAEKKKKEREASRRAMINPLAFKGTGTSKYEEDRKFLLKDDADFADERDEAVQKRIPPVVFDGLGEQELRKLAQELLTKLKRKYGKLFDMKRIIKKREYVFNELTQRIRNREEDAYKERKARTSGVSKYAEQGTFMPSQNFTPDQRRESILNAGGVSGRMAMFGGGGDITKIEENPGGHTIDITK